VGSPDCSSVRVKSSMDCQDNKARPAGGRTWEKKDWTEGNHLAFVRTVGERLRRDRQKKNLLEERTATTHPEWTRKQGGQK